MTKSYDLTRGRRKALGPPGASTPAIQPQSQVVPAAAPSSTQKPGGAHRKTPQETRQRIREKLYGAPPTGLEERMTLTLPIELIKAVRAFAKRNGMSVNDVVVAALARYVGYDGHENLPKLPDHLLDG